MPPGHPSDPSYVLPLLDKVQRAIEYIRIGPKQQVHSVAGDLGLNDAALRQALHARGILTVGIATTVEPIEVHPSTQDVLDILNEAGLNRKRTPSQVHLAGASGYSRPWWKVTASVGCRVVQAMCVTKVLRVLSYNRT